MQKKITNRFIVSDKQKQLLANYYDVDENNQIVTIKLQFDSIEDILDKTIISKNNPIFSRDILEKINTLIDEIPLSYKIDIEFYINDFLDYDTHKILKSFNDSLELVQFANRKANRKKWLSATIFFVLGISLLFLMIAGENGNWFKNEIAGQIISEIIDISAWVFLWEAVTMIFLEFNDKMIFSLKLKKRINSISFINTKDKEDIIKEKSEDFFTYWEDEGKLSRLGKGMLLFSSAALLCSSFLNIINLIKLFIDDYPEKSPLLLIIGTILFLITILLQSLAGIGGLFRYANRKGFLGKFVEAFSIVLIIFLISTTILSIIFGNISLIINELFPTIVALFYAIGFIIDKKTNKC